MLFRASLYFLNVINVTIYDIVVTDSIGMGVAMYDVTGMVTVNNSIFSKNKVPANEANCIYPGGGGFSVEFTFCKPGEVGLSDPTKFTKTNINSMYLFYNCTFLSNDASTINADTTTYANSVYGFGNLQFGRGGGLSVFFKGKASHNKVTINGCEFIKNHAIWGGGFHSDFVDHSNNNTLIITNSNFTDNHCHIDNNVEKGYFSVSTGGGGIRIGVLFYDPRAIVISNTIKIKDCNFSNNLAYYGGGVSYAITKEANQIVASNKLSFINCTWIKNKARTGSAVDLATHPWPFSLGVTPVVMFKDCTFCKNSNQYSNNKTKPVGIGALYSDSIPVNFTGTCNFMKNQGSAVAGSATYFSFTNDSITKFDHNVGSNGGALALLGNAYLILYNNTTLNFTKNRAFGRGGAIYFVSNSEREFISTQKCFLFYYDINAKQSDWNMSLYFEDNTDIQKKSIFCTTLLPCIWGNLPENTLIENSVVFSLFNQTFHFNDNPHSLIRRNSMTDAIEIFVDKTYHPLVIPPGRLYTLNITLLDEMGNKVHPALFIQTSNHRVLVDSTTVYSSDNRIRLYGPIGSKTLLQLQTINGRPWSFTINVKLADCPPGFIYNTTGIKNGRCICSPGDYYGMHRCDLNHLVAYMHIRFWAGIIRHRGKLTFVTADCPEGYCNMSHNVLRLPTSLTLKANAEYEAKRCLYRHSTLCGRCNNKYYIAINSLTYECTSDCKHSVLKLIILKYVPFTIFLLMIIFFNISLVDGPLNSFILFSQIINPGGPHANRIILKQLTLQQQKIISGVYYLVYGPWNLIYFEMFVPPFCIYRYNSTIKVLALEYIPALYPIFLFVLFYSVIPCITNHLVLFNVEALRGCLLRGERMFIIFRRSWSVRNSIIHGLTTFLVLSYAKVTTITGLLLASTTLYGNYNTEWHVKSVVKLDGTMSYMDAEHSPYAALAFSFLFTVVLIPPLLLLSYPLVPNLLNKMNYQDKWICKHLIIAPMDKCVPFFDAFQSCFKNEYRWFAGLYFLYRAMVSIVLTFTWQLTTRLICQQGLFLTIALVHCICQPYQDRRYNILDGTIFIILAMINSLALYNVFIAEMYSNALHSSIWVQLILVYVPFIYFAVFFFYHAFKWCQPKVKSLSQCLSDQTFVADDDDELPARLLSTDGSSSSSNSNENDASSPECSDVSDNEHEREMEQFIQCNDNRQIRRFTA